MTILTSAVLIYILSTTPVAHIRLVDKFSTLDTCDAVVEAIKKQELSEPPEARIGKFLQCVLVSYKYDPDGDGPNVPVTPEPVKVVPQYGEPRPCKHPITRKEVACKEASYTHTQ